MKKTISILAALLLTAVLAVLAIGGAVFADDCIEIDNVAQLKAMSPTGHYRLTADITMTESVTLESFSGKLDGNGKTISGLSAPLFEELSGTVCHLTLKGSISSSSSASVGVLANTVSDDLTVEDVTVECPVRAPSATGVGGLIGCVTTDKAVCVSLKACVNKGDLDGRANVGGMVGMVKSAVSDYANLNLTLCINEGAVHMTATDANIGVGGIVGYGGHYSAVVAEKCANRGAISSEGGDNGVGGIYGGGSWTSGDAQKFTARYCANTGDVSVPTNRGRAGGICGRMNRHGAEYRIEYCYNTGTITAASDSAAGIFSYSNSAAKATISCCYNAGEIKKATSCFPIAGHGAKTTVVAKDNYYLSMTLNNTGENLSATAVADKTALNNAMLALEDSPFIVDPDQNQGYAILAWECAHTDETIKTCLGQKCPICGAMVQVDPSGSHAFGAWVIDKEATETEDGARHRTCTACGESEYETLSMLSQVTPINGVYQVKNGGELLYVINGIEAGEIPTDCTIRLSADVNVNGALPTLNKTFTGVLDGNQKTLSGLTATLFNQFNGTVTALTLRGDIDTSASSYAFDIARKAASFAHNIEGATLSGLVSYVNLTTSRNDLNVGGLVGYAKAGNTLTDCHYYGRCSVTWTGNGAGIGGIVGWSNASGGVTTFERCSFGGEIVVKNGVAAQEAYIGGILGNGTNATVVINRCVSDGTITSEITAGSDYVGGVLGVNKNASTTLSFCVNRSVLTAVNYAGGILGGITEATTVTSCANYTVPTSKTVGALAGSAGGKSLTLVSCVDFSQSTLKLSGTSSNSSNSYTADKVVDLNTTITLGGRSYHKYNVAYTEQESGILVSTLRTTALFEPYISLRDDGDTHALRLVILTNGKVGAQAVKVSLVFQDADGKTVKTMEGKLGVEDSDFTLYSAVQAGGAVYFAAPSQALFGCVITDIPNGAWERVELSITDAESGEAYLAPLGYALSSMSLTPDDLPDLTVLGTCSPLYNSGPGRLSDRYAVTAEDSYMTVITDTTEEALTAYLGTLSQKGYQLIHQNTLDSDTYYTYKKFGTLFYFYHNKKLHETRVIADNASDLLSEINYTYSKKAGDTTEFYQYSLNYSFYNHAGYDPVVYTESGTINCGMCYIIKLPDNSVILIDSGHEMQSTAKSRAGLMKFLRQITDTPEGEKVTVSMWFFTHAHGDHVRMAADFLEEYRDSITLKAVTHNFPSYQVLSSGYDDNTFTLKQVLNTYYQEAAYHKLHTGEVIEMAGVTMEVVYTHEDAVTAAGNSRIQDFNATSTVLKIALDGKNIMLLGDISEVAEAAIVAMHSAAYLKSDIVQVTHHGFNYLYDLYPLINAPIAVFPQSMFNQKDPANSQDNLYKYQLVMKYSTEEYFAHKYTYKFTVENGEIKVEALPRYDAVS